MRIAIDILIGISIFFALAGTVGMHRMPDTFSRMQSSTNIGTMGVLGVIIGGIMYAIWQYGDYSMAVKIGILGVFYIVTNPISGHALAKGAYRHGYRPEQGFACDQYGEDLTDAD